MAPIEGGYNTAADIWSVGITMIELTLGEAPNAKLPMDKILLRTLSPGASDHMVELVAKKSSVSEGTVGQRVRRTASHTHGL
jgi:serine/threonine protein kinase